MIVHRMSMSKTDMPCNYWARGDVAYEEAPSGLPARVGTGAHLIVEHWHKEIAPPELPEDIAADAKKFAAQWIKWLEPRRDRILMCEIGIRYDADNDRAVIGPKRGEPGYDDHGPMVMKGTLDLVMRGEDGVLEVLDGKTGKKDYCHDEQLHVQALSVSRLKRENRIRVGFLFPRKTKCDDPVMHELDGDRLDREAGRVHRLLKTLPTTQPNSGDWCWRCPLKGTCPAWEKIVA